jgi:hypothetical protein
MASTPNSQLTPANNRSLGNIVSIKIFPSKGGDPTDIRLLTPEIKYYENLLSNTVTMSLVIADSGGLDTENKKSMPGILDGIPIRGGEAVEIVIEDSFKNKLTFSKDKALYVNRVSAVSPGTQKDVFILDLCTRDYLANEQVRIKKSFQGKISDSVREIIGDKNTGLGSKKPIEVDETLEPYRFIGNMWKPFKVCTWLASRSNPTKGIGHAAGYFFYETYDGFKFKSIDALMSVEPTKKYQYNNLSVKKDGYEPIQVYNIERNIDLHQNLLLGTYNNKTIYFDAFAFRFTSVDYDIKQQKKNLDTAGKSFVGDFVAETFSSIPTRFMTRILDNGYQPLGRNSEEQLQSTKAAPSKPMYDAPKLMSQTIMRYNELFSIKTNIIIRGDLNLRAGQTIYCEFPDLQNSKNRKPNTATSGKYLISSLCHRITPKECTTSLTLVRDSFTK